MERQKALRDLAYPLHKLTGRLIDLDISLDLYGELSGSTEVIKDLPINPNPRAINFHGIDGYILDSFSIVEGISLPARNETLELVASVTKTGIRLKQLIYHSFSQLYVNDMASYSDQLQKTFFSSWKVMTIDNINAVTYLIALFAYPTKNNADALKILKEANSPINGGVTTPLEMLSNTINGFWGPSQNKRYIFPQIVTYTDEGPKINMDFVKDVQRLTRADPHSFHGGCPNRFSVVSDLGGNKINLGQSTITMLTGHFIDKIDKTLHAKGVTKSFVNLKTSFEDRKSLINKDLP